MTNEAGSRWSMTARFWGDGATARKVLADVGAGELDCEIVADGLQDTTMIVARTAAGLYALDRLLERGVMVRAPDLVCKTTSRAAPVVKA
jgi:hypothetical protein